MTLTPRKKTFLRPLVVNLQNQATGKPMKAASRAMQLLSLTVFRKTGSSNHSPACLTLQPILDDLFENNQSFLLYRHGPSGRVYVERMDDEHFPTSLTPTEHKEHCVRRAVEKRQREEAEQLKLAVQRVNASASQFVPLKPNYDLPFLQFLLDYLRVAKESGYKSMQLLPRVLCRNLMSRGFVGEAHVGNPKEYFENHPDRQIKWVVGQIMPLLYRQQTREPMYIDHLRQAIEAFQKTESDAAEDGEL